MSDKKRFFYVVCVSANSVHAMTQTTDGGMFSGKEVICHIAKRESKEPHQVIISHWQELESEQDYEDFHK